MYSPPPILLQALWEAGRAIEKMAAAEEAHTREEVRPPATASRGHKSPAAGPRTADVPLPRQGTDASLAVVERRSSRKLVRTSTGHVIPALDLGTFHGVSRSPVLPMAHHEQVVSAFDAGIFDPEPLAPAHAFLGSGSGPVPPYSGSLPPSKRLSKDIGALAAKGIGGSRHSSSSAHGGAEALRASSPADPRQSKVMHTHAQAGAKDSRRSIGSAASRVASPAPATYEKRSRTRSSTTPTVDLEDSSRTSVAVLRARLTAAESEAAAARAALARAEEATVVSVTSHGSL